MITSRYSSGLKPSSMARTAAWVRSETRSFAMRCWTCFLTVLTLTRSLFAICWLVRPWASSPKTWSSLCESLSSRGCGRRSSGPLAEAAGLTARRVTVTERGALLREISERFWTDA